MSDCEKLKELFSTIGIEFDEHLGAVRIAAPVSEQTNVRGPDDIQVEFHFNNDGEFSHVLMRNFGHLD